MVDINIRQVNKNDVDGCYRIESTCYTSDGATREKMLKRVMLFSEGFLIAESKGKIIGFVNSASTDKEDIADEEFKDMVGHVKEGKNIVVFSLAVLPEFQGNGISKQLMARFVEVSKGLKKEKNPVNMQIRSDYLLQKLWFFIRRKIKVATRWF